MPRKNAPIEKRLTQATYQSANALSLFHRAADELDAAAATTEALADEADQKRRHFETLAQSASDETQAARANAAKIRSFIGA